MKYWNKEGKYQSLHALYFDTLVPLNGEADTPEGEALRAINRIYYDVYNNGASNIFETEEVYDDDGNYECDELTLYGFYEDFFDDIHRFTGDGAGVHALIGMCKRCAQGYAFRADLDGVSAIDKTLEEFMDKIIEKIHTTNGPALVQARQLNPKT